MAMPTTVIWPLLFLLMFLAGAMFGIGIAIRMLRKPHGGTNKQIVGRVIDTLRKDGVVIDSPYDFENFIADNCGHGKLFDTGRFSEENDE